METYTFVLPVAMANFVANAVAQMPYQGAAPVINELQRQVQEQEAAANAPPPEPKAPKKKG